MKRIIDLMDRHLPDTVTCLNWALALWAIAFALIATLFLP